MRALILAALLLTACQPDEQRALAAPQQSYIAYGGRTEVRRFYDAEMGVLCYESLYYGHGIALSCLRMVVEPQ